MVENDEMKEGKIAGNSFRKRNKLKGKDGWQECG
jgi:hypothetical protein